MLPSKSWEKGTVCDDTESHIHDTHDTNVSQMYHKCTNDTNVMIQNHNESSALLKLRHTQKIGRYKPER